MSFGTKTHYYDKSHKISWQNPPNYYAPMSPSAPLCGSVIRTPAMWSWNTHIRYVIHTLTSFVFLEKLFACRPWTYTKLESMLQSVSKARYRASSNSSKPFSNILCLLYCSKNAFLLRRRSNWSSILLNNYQKSDQRLACFLLGRKTCWGDASMIGQH